MKIFTIWFISREVAWICCFACVCFNIINHWLSNTPYKKPWQYTTTPSLAMSQTTRDSLDQGILSFLTEETPNFISKFIFQRKGDGYMRPFYRNFLRTEQICKSYKPFLMLCRWQISTQSPLPYRIVSGYCSLYRSITSMLHTPGVLGYPTHKTTFNTRAVLFSYDLL